MMNDFKQETGRIDSSAISSSLMLLSLSENSTDDIIKLNGGILHLIEEKSQSRQRNFCATNLMRTNRTTGPLGLDALI